ncbi:MAG: hypothetical protein V3V31_15080 [Methylococcales bacterium]
MKRQRKHKCLHCHALFQPDRRNVRHQKYCSETPCRKASKAASQRRWLAKDSNKNYFCGPENVQRVQAWRKSHPGYWRSTGGLTDLALQDDSSAQVFECNVKSEVLASLQFQDLLTHQGIVLIGLIAHLSDSPLQDDIAEMGRRLIELGGDILNTPGGQYVNQTGVMPRTGPPDSCSVQLDRSAIGSPSVNRCV